MNVYKIIVDKKPNNCTGCPLNPNKDCGKETSKNYNGSLNFRFIPDKRCKLVDLEELMYGELQKDN